MGTLIAAVAGTWVLAAAQNLPKEAPKVKVENPAAFVGTISGADVFELNGVAIRPEGVNRWPLPAGSEISTRGGAVTVRLQDGTVVVVGKESKVKVGMEAQTLSVRLLAGLMDLAPVAAGRVQFYNDKQAVPAVAGTVSTASTNAATKVVTPTVVRKTPAPISIR